MFQYVHVQYSPNTERKDLSTIGRSVMVTIYHLQTGDYMSGYGAIRGDNTVYLRLHARMRCGSETRVFWVGVTETRWGH